MPVQPLQAIGGSGAPQQALQASVQNQQQLNALQQRQVESSGSRIANAQSQSLQTQLAILQDKSKRQANREKITAQSIQGLQNNLFAAGDASANRKQQQGQFDKATQFAERDFENAKMKAAYDDAVDATNDFYDRTASLDRNKDGTFKDPFMQDQLDGLLGTVDTTGTAFGRKVPAAMLTARGAAMSAQRTNELEKESFKQRLTFVRDGNIKRAVELKEFAKEHAGNMSRAVLGRADTLSTRINQLMEDGSATPQNVTAAIVDTMGGSPELKRYVDLKFSGERGTSEKARTALANVAPEELIGFSTAYQQFFGGIKGSGVDGRDEVIVPFDDLVESAGIPSGFAGQLRSKSDSLLQQFRKDRELVKEHANSTFGTAVDIFTQNVFDRTGGDMAKTQAILKGAKAELNNSTVEGPLRPGTQAIVDYFSGEDTDQETLEAAVDRAFAREGIDVKLGGTGAARALKIAQEREEELTAEQRQVANLGPLGPGPSPAVDRQATSVIPEESDQPATGVPAPTPNVTRPQRALGFTEEDTAERAKFKARKKQKVKTESAVEALALSKGREKQLFEERQASLQGKGKFASIGSDLRALLLGEEGERSLEKQLQQDGGGGLKRAGTTINRVFTGSGSQSFEADIVDQAKELLTKGATGSGAKAFGKTVGDFIVGRTRTRLDALLAKEPNDLTAEEFEDFKAIINAGIQQFNLRVETRQARLNKTNSSAQAARKLRAVQSGGK